MLVEATILGIYILTRLEVVVLLALIDYFLIVGLGLYWDGAFDHRRG